MSGARVWATPTTTYPRIDGATTPDERLLQRLNAEGVYLGLALSHRKMIARLTALRVVVDGAAACGRESIPVAVLQELLKAEAS